MRCTVHFFEVYLHPQTNYCSHSLNIKKICKSLKLIPINANKFMYIKCSVTSFDLHSIYLTFS